MRDCDSIGHGPDWEAMKFTCLEFLAPWLRLEDCIPTVPDDYGTNRATRTSRTVPKFPDAR